MKKFVTVLLAFVLSLSLVGCGDGGPKPYIEIDGEQHDINYLFELNELQRKDYAEKEVTIVAELKKVNGAAIFSVPYAKVDSYIELDVEGGNFPVIKVDTSGYEDKIKNWVSGDMIKVTGKITYCDDNILYMFTSSPSDNAINVSKIEN